MRGVLVALASAAILLSADTGASAQNLFRRGPEPVEESVLAQVRRGDFAERCTAPVEGIEEERLEAYDLVDMLATAPTAVVHNVQLIDGQSQQMLTRLVEAIATRQPAAEGTVVSVHIEDTDFVDARQVRAGEIIVTRGLVQAVLSQPAEMVQCSWGPCDRRLVDMAFILAHEYAHVLLCHYNRQVAVSRNRRALRQAATLGLIAVALSNSSATRTATGTVVTTDNRGLGQDALAVMAGLTLLRTANSSIVNPSWARRQEREADQVAVELLSELGVTTEYVSSLLRELHEADEASSRSFTQILSQVPSQTMSALALSMGQANPGGSFQNSMAVVGLRVGVDMFQQWRENQLRHFHDSPDRRIAWLEPMRAFASSSLTEQQQAQLATDSFDSEWEQGQLDAAFEADANAPRLAQQAFTLFAADNFEEGCTVAEQALAANRDSVPALRACGQCELHRNNLDRARRHLDRAINQELARPEDFEHVLGLWLGTPQRERVEHVLTAGLRRFPQRFYIQRMYVLDYYGERDRIPEVAAACAAAEIPEQSREQCATEAARIMQSPPPQPAGQPAQEGQATQQ